VPQHLLDQHRFVEALGQQSPLTVAGRTRPLAVVDPRRGLEPLVY